MFGSCDWPWLSKAWTRHDNNNNNSIKPRGGPRNSPPGRPFVVLLIIAIAVLVPPRDVFGQTDANTLLVSSYDEIENNDHSDDDVTDKQHQQQEEHLHHPPPNKMVDGGAVSKVRAAEWDYNYLLINIDLARHIFY